VIDTPAMPRDRQSVRTVARSDLQLRAGGLSVTLAPELGGSVTTFRKETRTGQVDLLRPLSHRAGRNHDVIETAMFPLVPYANRIARNRFSFHGHTFHFEPNTPGEPYALHGSGWRSRWDVADSAIDAATLTLEHCASAADPYTYSARQCFRLTPGGLCCELGVVNRGTIAMPFGLGLHPFWSLDSDVNLRFSAKGVWLEGPDHLPTDRIPIPLNLNFSDGRAVPRTWLNNCYCGWDGHAELVLRKRNIRLQILADPVFSHLMLYCNPDQSILCVEPQTHASGALGGVDRERAGHCCEAAPLEPGHALSGIVSFTVFEDGQQHDGCSKDSR